MIGPAVIGPTVIGPAVIGPAVTGPAKAVALSHYLRCRNHYFSYVCEDGIEPCMEPYCSLIRNSQRITLAVRPDPQVLRVHSILPLIF